MGRNRVLSFMSQFSAGHKTPSPSPSPPNESSGVNFKPTATATHSPFPDATVRRPVTPPSQSDYGTPLNGSPRNSNHSSVNNSPPQYTRQRTSSRPLSMVQTYQPPLMDINEDTIPELQPIFSFLNSHSNKLYQEGYFLKLDDQNTQGKPNSDRTWTECFAQLVGTVLSLWDAAELDAAGEDGEVLPKFINLTDASIKMIESLPTRSNDEQPLQNILSISTAGRNRYLLHFNSHHSLIQWTAGIRLAMYEHSTLQEAYTGALIAGKGKTLNNINVVMERARFKTEEWVRVRFGAGVPWRRCWCVISPPDEKEYAKLQKELKKKSPYDRSPTPVLKGDIKFYDTRKDGKKQKKAQPIATITDAYSAYAIYPQAKSLIDASTLLKIEGNVTVHSDPPSATEGFIFVMPEVHPMVSGFEMLLRFLFPTWDTFGLYGRPGRLVASVLDNRSLMFAMPKHKRYGYLEILDVSTLILEDGTSSWTERDWRKKLKEATGTRMNAIEDGTRSPHSRTGSRSSNRLSFGNSAPGGKPKVGFAEDRGSVRSSRSFSLNGGSRNETVGSDQNRFQPAMAGVQSHHVRNSSDPNLRNDYGSPIPPMHASPPVQQMPIRSGLPDRMAYGEPASSDDEPGSSPRPEMGDLEGMRSMQTPEPVSRPPAFNHGAQARPTSKAYHSPELRRANSRLSSTTLAQLAKAGGIAHAGDMPSRRGGDDGVLSGPSVQPHANPTGRQDDSPPGLTGSQTSAPGLTPQTVEASVHPTPSRPASVQTNSARRQAARVGQCPDRDEGDRRLISGHLSKSRMVALDLILDLRGGEGRPQTKASLIASLFPQELIRQGFGPGAQNNQYGGGPEYAGEGRPSADRPRAGVVKTVGGQESPIPKAGFDLPEGLPNPLFMIKREECPWRTLEDDNAFANHNRVYVKILVWMGCLYMYWRTAPAVHRSLLGSLPMDGEEPTQATQNVLDPRRVGKQNSGFSDEDISDIICVLVPQSDSARREVQRLADTGSPYVIGRHEADEVEPDYDLDDHASRFETEPHGYGNYTIILRLSAGVKNPAQGFTFGRNHTRCDVVFVNDPLRRVSNIHFRIYVNEYGAVMIEDQSTNGTFVDRQLLTSHAKSDSPVVTKWVLSSGALIKLLLHDENRDLTFRVRVPRRDDEYAMAYNHKVEEYFARHQLRTDAGLAPAKGLAPPAPRTGGHVDLFKPPDDPIARRVGFESAAQSPQPSPSKRRESQNVMRREWNGSGKYNRIGTIGKGAFAVVYKVTSKYDGKPYAAKELEKRRFIKNGVLDQKVENEMKIMRRIQHPNIVRYMENIEWDDRLLIIIMEYIPGGDLGKIILDDGAFPEDMAQTMSKQLLSALGYLHTNNITHRDVKPDNILINTIEPLEVKLTDFGLSKVVDTEQTFLRTFCGTLLYCAPEVYTEYAEYDDNGVRNRGKKMRRVPGQRYNHAVDIWSLGGVLFYTMTGSPPYPVKSGISYSELLHKIMTTSLDIAPLQRYGVSGQGIDFLHRMLQRRPENRASIVELDNHVWLGGQGSTIEASQSYDEITDDEDVILQPSQFRPPIDYEDDRVSDSMDDEPEEEIADRPAPRLFGEVGVSAIGSSGVIPSDYLNLPAGDTSMGETEILDSNGDEAYDSGDSDTIKGRNRQAFNYNATSIYPNQSADQLQSLVENVASQSLGGKDSAVIDPLASSQYLSQSMDPNSSKRKPPSQETGDELDENTPRSKPTIKRFKSDGRVEDVTEDVLAEFRLLACVPQVKRLDSGRQVDKPVDKRIYWEQDRKTWHLHYPEMTQLQTDAFSQAALSRGEDFGPGKTPLWDIAMRYFPPGSHPGIQNGSTPPTFEPGARREDRKTVDDTMDIPSTAAPIDVEVEKQSQLPDTQIVVPVQSDFATNRAIAVMESDSESCVRGISFPITDSLVTFGRAKENIEVFQDTQEQRVPKHAFKVMLWKDGYDPSKDPAKAKQPWQRETSPGDDAYEFWISTKATLGIRINGYNLASSDARNPAAPSQFWAKLHDGDTVMIWGGQDPRSQTKLVFRCFWGGSATPRPADRPGLELAGPPLAQRLDAACGRTEKRVRDAAEKKRKVGEAAAEQQERARNVGLERERSAIFERKRQEAVDYLAAAAQQQAGSRRGSPANNLVSATHGSRAQASHLLR
ncbi:PH domain-containingprotein [Purpureocillium lavendulum]|uniref:Autophagy-related protein 1 n=1 Tax=Purpureocillium lavendulum TaxID=1247861 RepID=A0AB34G5S8_9HYPO|nr:PH domain-containingprotein [Purpureocillium lavendulum]